MELNITRLHANFVAEIKNLDLTQEIDGITFRKLQQTIDEHAVLVFRGQPLTEEQQIGFANLFGTIEGDNNVLSTGIKLRLKPELVDISNLDENNALLEKNDRRRMFALGNQLWHTDSSFKRRPAKYSLLHAHSVTPEGGETQYVDMRAAYDALPQTKKDKMEDLVAEHSIFTSRAKLGFTEFSEEERRKLPPVHRRVVRTHPGSGRKTLYLASHASHIVDWPVPDGKMLIRDLIEHATQPQFVYTHKWQVGDLVIWDNRCTLHRGRPYDEERFKRDLRRATIEDLDPNVQDLRVGV